MQRVAKEEKVTNNVCTLGGKQRAWFLTEDGLYEVLMQSLKLLWCWNKRKASAYNPHTSPTLKYYKTHASIL